MRKWFILFIIAILPLAASAETVQVGDLWYNLDDTAPVATVINSQDGIAYSGDIVIPATIEYGGTTYTVTGIGENAFNSCSEVNSVVISEGIQTIETSAFMQCYNMKWVELPSSLTTIGYWAFSFCSNLHYVISKIEDPSDIDKSNFFCHNLVVDSVETFGPSSAVLYVPAGTRSKYQALEGWKVFTSIFEGNRLEEKVGDLKYAYATSSLEAAVIADDYSSLESITIPASVSIGGTDYSVKAIGASAFKECRNLTSVTFNEGLSFISKEAFWSCFETEFSALPSTIVTIGYDAFNSCNKITKLVIPEGCTTIDASAFTWCNGLKMIELPSTLAYIGERAFIGASELSAVISRLARPFAIQDNVFCKEESWMNGVATTTKSEATLYVPTGTKTTYESVNGWNMFAEIVEGELKETKVGDLNYLYVLGGNTATVIAGDYKGLTDLTIPSTISVDGNAYSVVAIDEMVFFQCQKLKTVILNEGLKTIGNNAFQECWEAEFNDLPSTIISVGDYSFNNCEYFKKVTIPNGCISVGRAAFSGCGSMKRLTLSSTLENIGDNAFAYCRNLEVVISHMTTPINIAKNVFAKNTIYDNSGPQYEKSAATLYVPIGTKTDYQSIEGWNMFADIVEGELKETSVGNLTYSYVEGGGIATVIAGDYSQLTSVIIPGTVSIDGVDYSVKSIGLNAFNSLNNLESVKIEYGVESIGNNAFYACNSLKTIELPSTLSTIGDYAFFNCYLSSVIFPQGLLTIGAHAFDNCVSLNEISLPSSLITIEEFAFFNTRLSGSLVIPEGVKKIGGYAFRFTSIKSVELPSTLTEIGDVAFTECNYLSTVKTNSRTPFEIDKNVFGKEVWNETEQKYNFIPCSANLFVPEGTKSAYEKIEGWTMFAGIYEGEQLERQVGDLNYLYLPSSQTAMVISGDYSQLTEIVIPGTIDIDGTIYQVKEIGSSAFRSCYHKNSITISEGIEKIGDYAFEGCWDVEFSKLPSTITVIGNNAFQNCNMITSLIIPEGVQTIGKFAFSYCDGLQQVLLPNSLTTIAEYAFVDCYNLIFVTSRIQEPLAIPDNVFVVRSRNGEGKEESSAATLCVPEGTKARYQAIKGWTMFKEILEGEMLQAEVGNFTYIYNRGSGEAYVTKGANYSELRNITIPGTVNIDGAKYLVTAIGARAFSSTNITSVTLEEGIKSIEQEAFNLCGQLTKVSLPSSLEEIKVNAFTECGSLTSIEIPANVSQIREKAFSFCRKLSSIKVSADNRVYDSRNNCNAIIETATNTLNTGCKTTVIPESVTAIGPDAFAGSQFTEITIPSGVKTIGDEAFLCCDQFSEIVIPEGVESIGTSCFHSCYTMETIELPNSLKTLSAWSLGNCKGLVNLVTYIESPYEIHEDVFGDNYEVFTRAKLYVPKGKKSTYQRTECWSMFENVEEMIGGTLSVPTIKYNGRYLTLASAEDGRIYYSLDGTTPVLQYKDTLTCYDFATVKAIAKRFGSVTSDTLNYKIDYVYDGVTAKTAEGGLLAKCFEWSGTDKVEMLDIDGTLNDDDFGTIRGLSKLKTLNMAASKMANGIIPEGAFANTKLQWYVSPYTLTSVGANAFRGCNQLSAISWNSSSV